MGKRASISYRLYNQVTKRYKELKFNSVKEFKDYLYERFGYRSVDGIIDCIKDGYGKWWIIVDLFINGVRVI